MNGRTVIVRAFCLAVAVLLVLAMSGPRLWGSEIPITLTDLNTTVQVYSQSNAGIGSWTVNEVNQLNREWFWFRVGDASPTNPEQSIDTLNRVFNAATDNPPNPGSDYLYQQFAQNGQFRVELKYSLTGGEIGTGDSDLGLSIKIVNTSAQPLDFHFFQLADFDLAGTSGSDEAWVANANLIGQWNVTRGNSTSTVTVNPSPSLTQVDLHSNIYNLMTNSQGDDLNGTGGWAVPGNIEWGCQWNVTLAPNANLMISEDQILVPEPATVTLLAIGALGLLRNRRK